MYLPYPLPGKDVAAESGLSKIADISSLSCFPRHARTTDETAMESASRGVPIEPLEHYYMIRKMFVRLDRRGNGQSSRDGIGSQWNQQHRATMDIQSPGLGLQTRADPTSVQKKLEIKRRRKEKEWIHTENPMRA